MKKSAQQFRNWFLPIFLFFISITLHAQQKQSLKLEQLERLYKANEFDSILQYDSETVNASKVNAGNIFEIYAKTYSAINQDDKAFNYYKKAKVFYKKEQNLEKVARINVEIYDLLDSQKNLEVDKAIYLNEIKNYAVKYNSPKWLMNYYNHKGIDLFSTQKDSAKFYFSNAIALSKELDSMSVNYKYNINLGALYLVEFNKPDSAIYHYNKALKAYQLDVDENKEINNLFALYNNLGNAYREKKAYKQALLYYKKAEDIGLDKFDRRSKRILFSNLDVTYYYMSDWENAYDYLYKYDSINSLLENTEQKTNIKEIEEKYNNEKLRADNLEIESERLQNRNIALGLGGSIVLGGSILFLVFTNLKRKQKLVKQQQEIKAQKLLNQLKEQELKSIDALIEGQEKERLRIANDLHDDLGSLMATIKLHFGSFQNRKATEELYQKTNSLLEEAYQKIRSIAHAKNAGVLAKQGLSKALKNMAEKVSNNNQLQIIVHDFDFEQRLENSVELTLFRIVQELMTNAIKHGQASEIDIHLTTHENHINIMVEDNGIGFNPSQITKKNPGMGLSSIDKRVAILNGKLIIESEKNIGSTIIINLPL